MLLRFLEMCVCIYIYISLTYIDWYIKKDKWLIYLNIKYLGLKVCVGGILVTLFPGTKTVFLSPCHLCNQLKRKFRISGTPKNLSNNMKVVKRSRLRQSHGKLLPKLLVDINEGKCMQANEDVRQFPFWEATHPALENWFPCLRSWGVQEVWGVRWCTLGPGKTRKHRPHLQEVCWKTGRWACTWSDKF